MRLRTIEKRLKLSLLPYSVLRQLHKSMQGISDESTELNCKNNPVWVKEVKTVLLKHDSELMYEFNKVRSGIKVVTSGSLLSCYAYCLDGSGVTCSYCERYNDTIYVKMLTEVGKNDM